MNALIWPPKPAPGDESCEPIVQSPNGHRTRPLRRPFATVLALPERVCGDRRHGDTGCSGMDRSSRNRCRHSVGHFGRTGRRAVLLCKTRHDECQSSGIRLVPGDGNLDRLSGNPGSMRRPPRCTVLNRIDQEIQCGTGGNPDDRRPHGKLQAKFGV